MELKAKIRNGAIVQGKPRVFFCAHEKDYARCFDTISDLVLKHQNCAVWYWDDPTTSVSEEELLSLLSEMQLFVVPVTSAFLHTDNIGRCRDLQFAFDHHIPVLPLAVEAGLAADFNTICGNLQFLDLTAQDATAISVEEKVATFLQSVLVGDDVAKQVRAAFDAYVFLSYRKKDRRHAQELMRKIHENEQCRDVAIWYDEFLVPGEDFNDAIAQALNKSDLFALVVTPNLINEPNYVREHEYPAALESGKPILAAELVKTDRDILEKEFRSIPRCTNVIDRAAFNDDLMRAVSALSLRQNDHDPVHNYYIGLAYTAGIDVEKNAERGIQMIEGAAKAGVADAMQRLATVYEIGDGVPRNGERSLMWRERLADTYQKAYEEHATRENADKLLRAFLEWSQALARSDNRRKAIDVIKRLVAVAEQIREQLGSRKGDRDVVTAQLELCHLLLQEGDVQTAKALIDSTGKAALELVKCEEGETVDGLDFYMLSSCHCVRARVYEQTGDLKGAEFFYGAAIELCENLYKEFRLPMFLLGLSEASVFYGTMLTNVKKDDEKAAKVFTDAIATLEQVVEEIQFPVLKTNRIIAYMMLASCENNLGDHRNALAHAHRAIELIEKLVQKEPLPTYQRLQLQCYHIMSTIVTDPKEKAHYEQLMQSMVTTLYQKAPVLENAMAVASQTFAKAFELCQQDQLDKAKPLFEEIMKMLLGFSASQLTVLGGDLLATSCSLYVDILLMEDQPQKALSALKKLLPLVERWEDKGMGTTRSECSCSANVYYRIAKVYKELGKTDTAKDYAKKASFCYSVCLEVYNNKTVEDMQLLGEIEQLLGEIAEEEGNHQEASRHYTAFLQYAEGLAQLSETYENVVNMGVACAVLSRAECADGSYEEATAHAERALEIFKQMYKVSHERFLKDNIDLIKEILRTCKRKAGKGFLWF